MIEAIFPGKKKIEVRVDEFVIPTDQKPANGGEGSAPEPFDVFLASIVACAGIYAKGFCDVRKLNTEGMKVTQTMQFNRERKKIEEIQLTLYVPSDFPEKYESAVLKTMNGCTVKKQLNPDIRVESKVLRLA